MAPPIPWALSTRQIIPCLLFLQTWLLFVFLYVVLFMFWKSPSYVLFEFLPSKRIFSRNTNLFTFRVYYAIS